MHKRKVTGWLAATIVATIFCFSSTEGARADDFNYRVTRFESVGTPNFVDDFGDGDIAPWLLNLGTVTDEADGALHLKSPGSEISPFPGLNLNRSEARLPAPLFYKADAWTVTSEWVIDPDTELYEGISFAMDIVGGSTILAVGVLNYAPTEAAILGVQPGLVAFVAHTDSGFSNLALTSTSITPAQFTGNVLMEFDHPAGGDINVRISLDGGVTFIDFGSFSLVAPGDITMFLYADPLVGAEEPTPTPEPTCPTPQPTPVPDSEVCYKTKDLRNPKFERMDVSLSNFLHSQIGDLKKPSEICIPSSANGGSINQPGATKCCYKMKGASLPLPMNFETIGVVAGTVQVNVGKPLKFCEPCTVGLIP
ncbi:MAG: hypothetical protein KGZ30_01245 [Anaplasmataceae bacterium]|nr:hypothetical protein [Anaplasmataceae bacterium]